MVWFLANHCWSTHLDHPCGSWSSSWQHQFQCSPCNTPLSCRPLVGIPFHITGTQWSHRGLELRESWKQLNYLDVVFGTTAQDLQKEKKKKKFRKWNVVTYINVNLNWCSERNRTKTLFWTKKCFLKRQLKDAWEQKRQEKKKRTEGNKGGRMSEREEGKSRNDRLTQQWGVERVVLLVAMGTQDTFNLHIWCHEWGRGHLWQKLLPWLLASCT